MAIALRILGGSECDRAKGTGSRRVSGLQVVKHLLHVGNELQAHGIVVRGGRARDDGGGAHGGRNTVLTAKLVEAADRVREHMGNHETRQSFERDAKDHGTEALLDCPNGAFDLVDDCRRLRCSSQLS